jgi:hypothetical protein
VALLLAREGGVGVDVPEELVSIEGLVEPFISLRTLSAISFASTWRLGITSGCSALASFSVVGRGKSATYLLNILIQFLLQHIRANRFGQVIIHP